MDGQDEASVLALRAKSTGDDFYKSSDYSKAFANYLLALNIRRDWIEELKEAFTHSLFEWGNLLEKDERISDLKICYEEALKIFPSSTVILNNLGAHLLRVKDVKEASRCFRECLSVDPLYLPAHRNLESVSNLLVERWHFRMLNDRQRNECFRRAIQSVVREDDEVLDIGTGTGILSLFAAENKPKVIYACDYSQVMTTIASDIVEKNGFSQKIKVLNKRSNELLIPSDLRERVTLVITEIMDAGLLGEGLLESLDDAWNRLLVPTNLEKQRVVPKRADLYLVPVESSSLAIKYKHVKHNGNRTVKGNSDLKVDLGGPYDSEDLKSVEFKFLSEPYEIFNFDFNDPCNIKEHLEGKRNSNIMINCDKEGRLDAFIVWFNLHLNDHEVISTSPLSTLDTCWEQAVFPVCENIDVAKSTKIYLKLSTSGGKLSLEDYKINRLNSIERIKFNVSKDLMRFVNSQSSLKQYDIFLNKLLQMNDQSFDILELSVYPYIGMKILDLDKGKVASFSSKDIDIEFLKSQAVEHDEQWVVFHSVDYLLEYLNGGRKFNVVMMELFNSDGELNDKMVNLYPVIRKSMTEDCIMFPSEVRVHCQLIYSDWLESNSKLNNNSLLSDFKAFDTLNEFKTNNFIDLDINKLQFIEMSDELIMGKMSVDDIFSNQLREFTVKTQATCTGSINSILYWFSYGDEGEMISTRSQDFYRNQSAEILLLPLSVADVDSIIIKLNYMSCILKFNVNIITT